jgi:vacuolar-type H+-ATPase subunit E/Vma4
VKKQKKTAKSKPNPKSAKKPKKISKAKVEAISARKPSNVEKQEETMDRTALKAVAAQLKEMGSDIKVLKSDTDEALQKKVNEGLQKLPTPDMLKKLESIVPEKLVSVLKRDCIGIFIDLSDVSCVRCPEAGSCAKQFIANLKSGLKVVDNALPTPPAAKKAPKAAIAPATRYEAGRLVFVRDQPNPNPEGDPYHDTFDAVLK